MPTPVTMLSPNTRSAKGSALTNLNANEDYLVIPWSEIREAINSPTSTPDSLEDWLAAVWNKLKDVTSDDTNSNGQKITAGRRWLVADNGMSIDEGQFESGQRLATYTYIGAIYSVDQNPSRPTAPTL